MNKKRLFLLAFLLILGISLYFFLIDRDLDIVDIEIPTQTVVESNFTLQSTYTENNFWEYTITGQLPNPCYTTEVEEIVMESFPEQVTVNLTILEPDPEIMCTQVIEEYSYQGQFNASQDAQITLVIE